MSAGALAQVVVCVPSGGASVAPCVDLAGVGQAPTVQTAYLLDQYQGAFYEQATSAFDASIGAEFFGVGLVGVVVAWMLGKSVRMVLKPLGLLP